MSTGKNRLLMGGDGELLRLIFRLVIEIGKVMQPLKKGLNKSF